MSQLNKLYIDGTDAFAEWGVCVEEGGYRGVIEFPKFKKLDSNVWAEESGAEYDLSAPKLDTRTFSLPLCVIDVRLAEDLISILSDGAYHEFNFVELGRKYRLRLVDNTSFASLISLGKMTITLADDFPTVPTEQPYPLDVHPSGYTFNGIDFARFRVIVLENTIDSIRKAPQVNPKLTINSNAVDGVIYDACNVTFKTKDMALRLFIRSANIADFWKSYNALFATILKPNTHYFAFNANNSFPFFYNEMKVDRFELYSGGKVWCELTLIITITDTTPVSTYHLLTSESGEHIITEGETPSLIIVRTH